MTWRFDIGSGRSVPNWVEPYTCRWVVNVVKIRSNFVTYLARNSNIVGGLTFAEHSEFSEFYSKR